MANNSEKKWLFTADPSDQRGIYAAEALLSYGGTAPKAELLRAKAFMSTGGVDYNAVHPDVITFVQDVGKFHYDLDKATKSQDPAAIKEAQSRADAFVDTFGFKDINAGNVAEVKRKIESAPALDASVRELALSAVNALGDPSYTPEDRTKVINELKSAMTASFVGRKGASHKSIDEAPQKVVYDNVFGKWSQLNQNTKDFYNRYLELIDNNTGERANENVYETAKNNGKNYRLNLVRATRGIGAPQFQEDLPKDDVAGVKFKEANLPGVYAAAYAAGGQPSGKKSWEINAQSVIRDRLMAIADAEVEEGEAMTQFEGPMLDMSSGNVVMRQNGKMFIMDNGKPIALDDPAADAKFNKNCYSLNVYTNNPQKCGKMFDCLVGSKDAGAFQACLAGLKLGEGGFFQAAKEEIKNIHPVLALRVLQQFGFKKYKDTDGLWKVQTVQQWLDKYMSKRFDNADIQKILRGESREVLNYLDLVAQYVNANPAILNKDYTPGPGAAMVIGQQTAPYVPEYARKMGLTLERPLPPSLSYDIGRLRQQIGLSSISRPFNYDKGMVTTPFGRNFYPGGIPFLQPKGLVGQFGGGTRCDYVIRKISGAGGVTGASTIAKFWSDLKAGLASRNKTLNKADEAKIDEKIATLQTTETEALKTLCYIDEFNMLTDAMRDYNTGGLLTLEKMKSMVDRYDKINKKQEMTTGSLMNVYEKLAKLLDGADGTEYKDINIAKVL